MKLEHTFAIPVYGESPYLEACVQSLLNQTNPGKVLITTSTPTEFTRELAEHYSLPYLVNPNKSAGIAADWNYALSLADTPWVTLAHQDDIYHTDYRKNLLTATEGVKDALIAFTNYNEIAGDNQLSASASSLVKSMLLLPLKVSKRISSKLIKRAILTPGCPICCPSVAFNLAMLKDFEFDSNYKCALDWEAWLRLTNRRGSFIYIDEPLVTHRLHPQSETSVSIGNGARIAEEKQLLAMLWGKWLARPVSKLYALGHRHNQR